MKKARCECEVNIIFLEVSHLLFVRKRKIRLAEWNLMEYIDREFGGVM